MLEKPKKPNEIPYPPRSPEIQPAEEPEPTVWPTRQPEIIPEKEPERSTPPVEIPSPPESHDNLKQKLYEKDTVPN